MIHHIEIPVWKDDQGREWCPACRSIYTFEIATGSTPEECGLTNVERCTPDAKGAEKK